MQCNIWKLLLLSFIFLSLSILFSDAYCPETRLLGFKIYLKGSDSDVIGYKDVSFILSINRYPYVKTINASNGIFQIEQWISRAIPSNITISRNYNFLFSIYGNSTSNGKFLFDMFLYRNFSEIFLFRTSESENINNKISCLIWQYEVSNSISFLQNDRLILKLYVNTTSNGTFSFLCDGISFQSYFIDPTETRYMRSDIWTINGLGAYKLYTSQTTSNLTSSKAASGNQICYWGIRVYKRLANDTQIEITSGSEVAVVSMILSEVGETMKSASWTCPETNLTLTDAILIQVRGKIGTGSYTILAGFITKQLGATVLNASSWTVYYQIQRDYYVIIPKTTSMWFYWGDASHNARIENFVYTQQVYSWHYMNWTYSLNAKQWHYLNWIEDLNVKQWHYLNWIEDLNVKQWHLQNWTYNLNVKQWNIISWIFDLNIKQWNYVSWRIVFGKKFNASILIAIFLVLFMFLGIPLLIVLTLKLKGK